MSPSLADLERLAFKYRTLAELRRSKARGDAPPAREVFRDLAAEFPGALKELDTLTLDVIDRRAEGLAEAAAGGAVEPWMAWVNAYHALARAALFVRLRGARLRGSITNARALDPDQASALAAHATSRSGASVDAAFVLAVLDPPGGRMNAVLYDHLSIVFGEPAAAIKQAIFPSRASS